MKNKDKNSQQFIAESRQREKEIEKIFNMTGYMVCIASIAGYFLRINESFVETLGYSKEELLSRPYIDFIHPDDKQKTIDIVREKLEQGAKVIGFENRYICKDGKHKWLSWTSHPVIEEGITYAITYDITKRKKALEALRENEERYRRVVQDQTEFIVRWQPGGIITFVNDSYCRYFGTSPVKMLGNSFFPLISEDSYELVMAKIRSITAKNPVAVGEHRVLRPDGSIGWNQWTDRGFFDKKGKTIEYQSVGRDITERKNMEQEQKMHLEFENLLRNISARFIDIPSNSVDDEIIQAIKMMVLFLDVDRGGFIRVLPGEGEFKVTHLWAKEGIEELTELINSSFLKKPSWLTQRISKGEVFKFSDPQEIPRQALSEKKFFLKQGVKSQITIPLKVGEEVLGALGFVSLHSNRHWSKKISKGYDWPVRCLSMFLGELRLQKP
tara:strand:+ start:447 stop:1769 length:1323 start_codon:yes stop_codon:yes gene_type:complete